MIFAKNLVKNLKKNKIDFFVGVPDSVLKNLSYQLDKFNKSKHIISTNEGSAVALGIGYYLSTRKVPCVYLQNSGLGNAINPLISIAHKKVYSIPLLLLIGWRGSPNLKDEPQHQAKGKITPNLLKTLGIDYCILRKEKDFKTLSKLIKKSYEKKIPIACLVEKNTIHSKRKIKSKKNNKFLKRSDFITKLLRTVPQSSKIISTTGYTSRELMQIRSEKKLKKGKDFYMVGGMGHSLMVALGFSANSKKKVICLDGDGSLLMHMGSLRTAGYFGNSRLLHILLNNNTHESVGGQETTAKSINFEMLVKSLGYKKYFKISKNKELDHILKKFISTKGPSFLEVKISEGSLKNMVRPKNLLEIKNKFMST